MSTSASPEIRSLEQTFQTFNQISESLEVSYHCLENQVTRLHSELKKAEFSRNQDSNKLSSIVDRFTTILESLPAGVVVLDHHGCVQECNHAAANIFSENLTGKIWREVVQRKFLSQFSNTSELTLLSGLKVNVLTCPLKNSPGQILLIMDVTETVRLKERLAQHHRLVSLGETMAALAHQIRTPLSAGLLCASQLKNVDTSIYKTVVEKLISNLRHLENLVNDMLLFSRDGYCFNDKVSLKQFMDTLSNFFEKQCECKNIRLKFHSLDKNVYLVGNKSILQSAMQNIVNNAIHMTPEGGQIDIAVLLSAADRVDISITDTGPGISDDVKDRIFTPFFTTREKGTGLGLAVAKAIASAHNGDIWLDKHYQNGSRFVLRLPITN